MNTSALSLSLLAAALLALGTPATAGAAPDPTAAKQPDPETKKKAREHFAKGGKHYSKARYKEAIVEFTKAYSFWKNPRILLNIAICHSEMNNAVQAVIFLRRALKTANDEQRAKLQGKIPAALKARPGQVADLEVVMPEGAVIYLNDKKVGPSPVRTVVAPGTVRVVAKVDGETKLSQTLTLTAGEKRTLAIKEWPKTQPKPGPSWRTKLARLSIYYVGAAALVTLAGLAGLVGTAVRTEQIQDDYYGNPNLDTRDQGIRYRTATNVLIGITVTAAVATGVLALFTDWKRLPWKKEKSKSTRIVPTIGPGGLGLAAEGRF